VLAGDLIWVSTLWRAEANEVVAPRLGLPVLPFVDRPDADEESHRELHSKTTPLTRSARTILRLARRRDHQSRPAR
jgi:hypothetical protein